MIRDNKHSNGRPVRCEIVARREVAFGNPVIGATVCAFDDGAVFLMIGPTGCRYSLHIDEADALAIAEALTGAVAEAPDGRRKLDEAYVASLVDQP